LLQRHVGDHYCGDGVPAPGHVDGDEQADLWRHVVIVLELFPRSRNHRGADDRRHERGWHHLGHERSLAPWAARHGADRDTRQPDQYADRYRPGGRAMPAAWFAQWTQAAPGRG